MKKYYNLIFFITYIVLYFILFLTLFMPNIDVGLNTKFSAFNAAGFPIFDHGTVTYFLQFSFMNILVILLILAGFIISILSIFKYFQKYYKQILIILLCISLFITIFTLFKISFTHIADADFELVARNNNKYKLLYGAYVTSTISFVIAILNVIQFVKINNDNYRLH